MLLPTLSYAADDGEDEWYGWQLMPGDAVALSAKTYSTVWGRQGTTLSNSLGYAGLGGYTLTRKGYKFGSRHFLG